MGRLPKLLGAASALILCLTLAACSGSSGSSVPTPQPDFTISATPTAVTLTAGGAPQSISVLATAVNNFTGTIAVTLTGLPAGVTASPSVLSLTPGAAQTVTFTAAANATTGAATLTVTAVSGSIIHSVTLSGTVNPPPLDFTLTASPATIALTAGATGSPVTVTASAVNAFTGTVAVAITGLPTGVTASPASLTLTPGVAQTVTITASSTATLGTPAIVFTGTSGSLTHSATVSASIFVPAPDFSLAVSPTTATITGGGSSGAAISVTATAANGFSSPVAVALSGLPTGVTASPATLTLTPGTAQTTTLTAAVTAPASTPTVTFTGTSGTLTHSATLALTVNAAARTTAPDVTTYRYNNARDGLNAQETILTPANVNATQFGKLAFDTVDGKVDAEPLYLANVPIAGALHNVLYVATEHGSLYAFDADTNTQLWKTAVITGTDKPSDDHGCYQVTPEIGVTSTPVIDRAQGPNGAIFLVAMSKDTANAYHQRLHALDLTTGAELSSSPTEITATYPGTGYGSDGTNVPFAPALYTERAALLLLNGNIYTTWTSHCDQGLYTGWVIGYSESTLKQTSVLNLTPNGRMGAVWMAGDGLQADSTGNIYLLDGNGSFESTLDSRGFPIKSDYGNSIIRLSTAGGNLTVADYFQANNGPTESSQDIDLGSGGSILLPDLTDANGVVRHLIVGAGKNKNILLADRDNLGKFNPTSSPADANLYQKLTGQIAGPVFSVPAFFNGTLYMGGMTDNLKAFPVTNAKLAATFSSKTPTVFAFPGATPVISANGTQNAIVWALESPTNAATVLHAYAAADLGTEYYNSNQATGSRDALGTGNKFITPLVVNGKVYVATQTGVAVFGLLPH